MISMRFDWHEKTFCWSKSILQGTCPCLPLTTNLRHWIMSFMMRQPNALNLVLSTITVGGQIIFNFVLMLELYVKLLPIDENRNRCFDNCIPLDVGYWSFWLMHSQPPELVFAQCLLEIAVRLIFGTIICLRHCVLDLCNNLCIINLIMAVKFHVVLSSATKLNWL